MSVGNIVMANSIVDTHGQQIDLQLDVDADPAKGLYVGRLLTADAIVRRVDDKRELGEKFGAVAVDLESLAVAQVCRERNTGFMSIRVISDDMSNDLPAEVLTLLGSTGTLRVGAALGAVWKRFGSVKDMWHLRENAYHAAERLAVFLDGVITQLHRAGK
jgi:adenosylhomocysteine nucleosidase